MPRAKVATKRMPKGTKVPPKAGARIPDETAAEKRKRLAEEKKMKARK
jgi:putative hemolysin